ncbi:Uncharacterised protein [Vibrio cholerae]|nr:Uncharacterised protein [Vibrio cholerae]
MVQAFFAWSTVAFTIATQVDCEHIDFAAWRARFTFAWGCSLMVIPR